MRNYWVCVGLWMVAVCISICFGEDQQSCSSSYCQNCTSAGDGWNSELMVIDKGARNATLRWNPDSTAMNVSYVVEYLEEGTFAVPIRSEPNGIGSNSVFTLIHTPLRVALEVFKKIDGEANMYMYVITGLTPETTYEVQVCLAASTETCGNCVLCFTTLAAEEPPGQPNNIMVTASGPSTLTVTWMAPITNKDIVTEYFIQCDSVDDDLPPQNTTRRSSLSAPFYNLTPNTTYECTVIALSPFGNSDPATAQAMTPPRETAPGLLLIVNPSRIEYVQLTESSLQMPSTILEDRTTLIDSISGTISGVDYHFHDEALFVALTSGLIERYNISVMSTDSGVLESLQSSNPVEVYSAPSGNTLGDITVDWLHNTIYWIESTDSGVQIKYMPVGGGQSFCSVEWTDRPVNHLAIDPVHGYIYWSTNSSEGNGGLFQASLGDLESSQISTCPDELPSESTISSDPMLRDFVLEPDVFIYFVTMRGLQFIGFDQQNNGSIIEAQIMSLDAFGDTVIIISDSNPTFSKVCNVTARLCQSTISVYVDMQPITDILTFRKSKQPLPAPPSYPTNVRVITGSNVSVISWKRPDFVVTFFGPSAFDDWTYCVNYSVVGDNDVNSNCTRNLQTTLYGLQSSTVYQFTLSAIGPGGERVAPDTFVFQTKAIGSESAKLLIATDVSVLEANLDGSNFQPVGEIGETTESNGIAYDFQTDLYFWIIEGGQGPLYRYNTSTGESSVLQGSLDRPVSLAADWVARRLFWVQDGDTVSDARQLVSTTMDSVEGQIETVARDPRITAITLDSLNGFVFWISGNDIMMKNLNGLESKTCTSPTSSPIALAVDVSQQLLYWLTVNAADSVASISQLEYAEWQCGRSSSRGVLAYGLGTLYLTTVSSSNQSVYSFPANLSAISESFVLTYGVMNFQPNVVRDIAVMSEIMQPLPDGLDAPGLSGVAPQNLSFSPRLRSNGSTTSDIIIEWGESPSDIPQSVVYEVEYTLSPLEGDVVSGMMITPDTFIQLENQTFYTLVTVSVSPHTLWLRSDPSQALTSTFHSPPARPDQVMNVRVYVYQPVLYSDEITALIVWDPLSPLQAGGIVNRYIVNVSEVMSGTEIEVTQNDGNQSYFVVRRFTEKVQFGPLVYINTLRYPLQKDTTYRIQVYATNDGGDGPLSQSVTFSTHSLSPPLEVLVVTGGGSLLDGAGNAFSYEAVDPVAVNTIVREIYWFSGNGSVMVQSLDGGEPHVLVQSLPISVVSMAFEWQGERLYMVGYRPNTTVYEIWCVPIVYARGRELVYRLSGVVEDVSDLVVDSFRQGAAYWLQKENGQALLFHLNLSNPTNATQLTLTNLSAITLDPSTGDLWVSYQGVGGIYSCNSSYESCIEEVSNTTTGEVVTSIALDELRVYWTDGSSIYYVNRSLPNNVMIGSNITGVKSLLSLSPGRQPQFVSCMDLSTCLAPDIINTDSNPTTTSLDVTNTSVEVWWTKPDLHECCYDVVFSYPPLMYRYQLMRGEALPSEDPFATHLMIDGLEPHEEYELSLQSVNMYTLRSGSDITRQFLFWFQFETGPGVPDAVNEIYAVPFGVTCIGINWTDPMSLNIRGDDLSFFVVVTEMSSSSTTNNGESNEKIFMNLSPGVGYDFEVIVSNMEFNSSGMTVLAMTWPLAPPPLEEEIFNTSFTVSITLEEKHRDIVSLKIKARSNENDEPESNTTVTVINDTFPMTFSFTVLNVLAHTEYDVRAVATYARASYANITCDTTQYEGQVLSLTTAPGVPDAPQLYIMNGIAEWKPVNPRGSDITTYRLEAEMGGVIQESFIMPRSSPGNITKELSDEDLGLSNGVEYTVRVYAENVLGSSDPSNEEKFTPTRVTSPEDESMSVATIIGVSAGGAIFAVVAIVVLFLCVFFLYKRSQKQSVARLSYAYGPDLELSNVRAQRYHQTNAANPQYMWSREDFVATEEELAQLCHFPRQRLKLQTFIGQGEFGEVYQGTAYDILGSDTGLHPVAIKTFRKGASAEERHKFLSEAALMGKFDHPNIVKILAVCVDNDPVYIIMELMPAGDLLKFLREAHPESGPALLTREEQLQIALDVAHGCRHLEQQHFIHRDIAARNCLVSSKGADRVVKIGDFGLAKDLYSSDYYQVEGQRKLPVRWMSPEALLKGRFTIESDVWSYGVLLFEVMSFGNQPYPGLSNQDVLQFVTGGGRLPKPDNCPQRVYRLMMQCWRKYASERPRFEEIDNTIENILQDLQRESYCESDSEDEPDSLNREGSKKLPSRTPSFRSGFTNLVRTGSQKLRNSLRRHSMHRREDQNTHTSVSSSESLIPSENTGDGFRESGLI